VAVVVFDTDVLIGFRHAGDAHHDAAVERVSRAVGPDTRRLISAVNYTELLIGPFRAGGKAQADRVDAMLAGLGIETVHVDMALARRAASVRAQTNLKLPDAYAVATAVDAGRDGDDVRIESFDDQVVKAFERLSE
jgi:predicted nucleic acid-binding protein